MTHFEEFAPATEKPMSPGAGRGQEPVSLREARVEGGVQLFNMYGGSGHNHEEQSGDDDFGQGQQSHGSPNQGQQGGSPGQGKSKTPGLDAFGRDLTELARQGKLDPVIGREQEMERMIQILMRRAKNNPVLLGEAGVGKTAIVEGFAQAIVKKAFDDGTPLPEEFWEKRIVVLDLAMMVAGTKYRGQFEERMKAVVNEAKTDPNLILFIDELHTLVGAGGAEGAIDSANMLKPELARGDIQVIGGTTLDEYRKHVEKDPALARRFQEVWVDEPSEAETAEILKGLLPRYAAHHRCKYAGDVPSVAAKLAQQYITDRYQPDKSIDLIDEAGARKHIQAAAGDPKIQAQLEGIGEQIKETQRLKEQAVADQDFEGAANYRNEVQALKLSRSRVQDELAKSVGTPEVTADDIADVVSMMTGIPMGRMAESLDEKALRLEEEIHKTVIGQHEAAVAVAKAVRRQAAGLSDPKRPNGIFIFAGPTGVGKTLLTKTLAKVMFGDEEAVVQIDMSEYQEAFNVSRLTGAPPGYVGYEEGGQLTEKIRRKPYCVLLLDEIEKAHGDVFNILLQVMEEGRLTDSFGRQVDFSNTILIMTTNAGIGNASKGYFGLVPNQQQEEQNKKQELMANLQREFRPEFLGRLDDVIVFDYLKDEDMKQILELEVDKIRGRLETDTIVKPLTLELDDAARKFLLKNGTNLDYGARPLRRALERHIEDPISEDMLSGRYKPNQIVKATHKPGDKALTFKAVDPPKDKPVLETAVSGSASDTEYDA